MIIIKLDAIDSTNDFLKKLSLNVSTKNFTIVTAESQTNGKGQMGSKWNSETGKNLIVSILIKKILIDINKIFDLNILITLSIIKALEQFNILDLSIKWPNDIMSGNKKIGGILIENIIKSNNTIDSIIGFGININQNNFSDLPQASSMKLLTGLDFDKQIILDRIIIILQEKIAKNKINNLDQLWHSYNKILFKKDKLMPFEDINNNKFMGIIQEVTQDGKLQLLTENDVLISCDIKEIRMIY